MRTRFALALMLGLALFFVGATLLTAQSDNADSSAHPSRPMGPCDVYAAAGDPCVAAHSTTRALYASYNGPLYQIVRQSDGKLLDIGVARSFDPRFLPTLGHPHAVALPFARCDLLVTGLAPVRVRPCWAHKQKGPGSQAPFALAAFFFAQLALNLFRRAALHLGRAIPSVRSTAADRTLSSRSFEISPCRSSISVSIA